MHCRWSVGAYGTGGRNRRDSRSEILGGVAAEKPRRENVRVRRTSCIRVAVKGTRWVVRCVRASVLTSRLRLAVGGGSRSGRLGW